MPLTVYLDETGFTGNNLLDDAQPIFVVSAVAIQSVEAADLVADVSTEFALTAKELKGSKLCRSPKGQRAVLKILNKLEGRFRYIAINKRYAAACKVFEYIVEPTISDCNWFFYAQRLHYFVADAVYAETRVNSREILLGLATAIRERNPGKGFEALRAPGPRAGSVLSVLKELANNNRDDIVAEFKTLEGLDEARWIMDLSGTALFSLLCNWAESNQPLDVHCDESKPLAAIAPHYSGRIGAKSEVFKMPHGDERKIFTLAGEIKLEKSDEVPGLQIADVVAAAAASVLHDSSTDFAKAVGPLIDGLLDPSSMYPGSRPFTAEEATRAGDLLVMIAMARTVGMSPCQRLKEILERAKKMPPSPVEKKSH